MSMELISKIMEVKRMNKITIQMMKMANMQNIKSDNYETLKNCTTLNNKYMHKMI